MGTTAFLIKSKDRHNPEKVYLDIALVCWKINLMFTYLNNKSYHVDGSMSYVNLNIANDSMSIKESNNNQFNFYLENCSSVAHLDYDFEWISPNENLCKLSFIEDVDDNNTELVFNFVYEYLNLNPDEYFWFGTDSHAFSWEDMKKLKEKPYDPDWWAKIPS